MMEVLNPVKTTGFFCCGYYNDQKSKMKFLVIIWAIRFLFASLNRLDKKRNAENKMDENINHPAEFGLR